MSQNLTTKEKDPVPGPSNVNTLPANSTCPAASASNSTLDPSPATTREPAPEPAESDSTVSNTKFSDKERVWILSAIVAARTSLDLPLDESLSSKVYREACNLLSKWVNITGISKNPSERSARVSWKNFFDPTKTLVKVRKGRKEKNLDPQIEAALAADPNVSLSEISRNLGVSKETIRRRVKSKKAFHKSFYQRKKVGPSNKNQVKRRLQSSRKTQEKCSIDKTNGTNQIGSG